MRLPYKSRDPRRIIRMLEPKACDISGIRIYVWQYREGLSCYTCLYAGSLYESRLTKVRVRDSLSGLVEMLRAPIGLVDGNVVWEAKWSGSEFVVDRLRCMAVIASDGKVLCNENTFTLDEITLCFTS